jgi:hypothetical protein
MSRRKSKVGAAACHSLRRKITKRVPKRAESREPQALLVPVAGEA